VPVLRRHVVLVFVERLDLAAARALRYARMLAPDELRAVHFVLDTAVARELEEQWVRLGLTGFPLELIECPDRRLNRASMELVAETTAGGETEVSVLLPRRVFESAWRRVLHDRTADRIAGFVSQLPNASATIVPFPLGKRRLDLVASQFGGDGDEVATRDRGSGPSQPSRAAAQAGVDTAAERRAGLESVFPPGVGAGTVPIGSVRWRQRARVAGRVRSVRVQPRAGVPSLECTIADQSGQLLLVFQGRRRVPGIEPGARLVVEGMVGERGRSTAMVNPLYWITSTPDQPEAPPE